MFCCVWFVVSAFAAISETSWMTTMLLLVGLNGSGVAQIIHYLIKLIKYIKIGWSCTAEQE